MGIKSDRLKDETASAIAADALNNLSGHMGYSVDAHYYPHCDRFQVDIKQINRANILRENARLYNDRKGQFKGRSEVAGGYPMTIPEQDWQEIMDECQKATGVNFHSWPQEERRKLMIHIYKTRPEFRIG